MQVPFLKRTTVLALLVAGLACAGNNESNDTGPAALDTTGAAISDSASTNQTESGVTATGDTVNAGVDTSTTPQ
jgi:hypothetical protein